MIQTTPTSARKFQAILRNDLPTFIHKAFTTLCPGQEFERSWHIKAIAYRLEQVRRGEIKRLIINMPPRSLKSISASVAFPAFVLGRDPTRRLICVSYSAELAKKHSNDFRALVETPWYRSVFPATRIGPYKNSEIEIEFTSRGFRLATSVGGTLTGRGGDIIIIDDPLKPADAYSETKRNQANEWFRNTLLSRLDDKRTGAIVIVMQRVHMDDLTGFVTGQSGEWKVLNLPAIAEVDEDVPISATEVYHRRAGEALSPVREPLSVLEDLKRQLGSDAFSAQYQQMPVPPGGAMIKRHWIERYNELPPEQERLIILQSWDTANKGGPENDFSVCTTWVVTRNRRWYLIDVWRKRVDYPELKAAVQTLAAKYKATQVLVEDAGAGTSLVQELRSGKVLGIVAVKPERDKVSRMSVVSAKFESGEVFLPERAPWLADFERELFAFPGAKHDDQCDSVSQAISEQNYKFPMIISMCSPLRSVEELDAGQYWPGHFDAFGVVRDDMRASRLQFRNDHETRRLAHVVSWGRR
jgi:predicted phage terminase large subunit-like protein